MSDAPTILSDGFKELVEGIKTVMHERNQAEAKCAELSSNITKLRCALDSVSADPNLSEQAYAMCRQVLFDTKP